MKDYNKLWSGDWGDMQKHGPVHRTQRRLISEIIKDLDFKSVLDVGCGEGSNLRHICGEHEVDVCAGIDVSEEVIARNRSAYSGFRFHVLDVQNAVLDEKFDLVVCCDVIEHLPDDVGALKNIRKMSNKYVLISTLQGRMREFEKNIGHVRNYMRGELEDKMTAAGMQVIKKLEWGYPLYSPLYRDFLNRNNVQKRTFGSYGLLKKTVCNLLYYLFYLNSKKNGDIIIILAKVE